MCLTFANLCALSLVTPCLLLCHCTQPAPGVAPPQVEWRVVGHHPLTYAPKGFPPPVPDSYDAVSVSYVYVMDRPTRYYIPWNHAEAKRQALLIREASKTRADNCHERTEALADGALRLGMWTLYAAAMTMAHMPPP